MSWAVKKRPRRELLPSVQLSNTVDLNFTQKASLPPEEDWSLEMKDEAQTFQEADSVPYSFRTYDHLVSDLHIAIRTCAEMLQISPTCSRLLLACKKWSVEDAIACYYDEREVKIAKLIGVSESALHPPEPAFQVGDGTDIVSCSICTEEVCTDFYGGLGCQHKFCRQCWANYLEALVTGEMDGRIVIKCMDLECKMIVEDDLIPLLLDDSQTSQLYQKLLEMKYINSIPRTHCCRGLNCKYAMQVWTAETVQMKCHCGFIQCSECRAEGHEGLPCWLNEKWRKKLTADVDQENLHYLMVNTKECPRCRYNIEKSGGCNHMTCRICRMEFCYLCGDPWSRSHSCGKYCGDEKDHSVTLKAWEEVERLIFYASRHTNQISSLQKEKSLESLRSQLIDCLDKESRSHHYADFLDKAVEVLKASRTTLSHCIGFSYFVKRSPHLDLFDHNVDNLERDVEELSGFLEKKVADDLENSEKRLRTMDLYSKCISRRQNLLGHIAEGFEKMWWIFQED